MSKESYEIKIKKQLTVVVMLTIYVHCSVSSFQVQGEQRTEQSYAAELKIKISATGLTPKYVLVYEVQNLLKTVGVTDL